MAVSSSDLPSEEAIRKQLVKILASHLFAKSRRLGRFLNFTIDYVLAGKQDDLKEFLIGVEVYDRRSAYHPNIDSIVRTEARRLREKLGKYYENDGKRDPMRILFRPGSYIPAIRLRGVRVERLGELRESGSLPACRAERLVVSVHKFMDFSGTVQSAVLARGVTAELLHNLMGVSGCQVVSISRGSPKTITADLHIVGDIQQCDDGVRVHCRVLSAEGFQMASHRLNFPAEVADSFCLQDKVASAVVSLIAPNHSLVGEFCGGAMRRRTNSTLRAI